MLCESCHTNEATVHIATVLYASATLDARHFCTGCAEVARTTNPVLTSATRSLPTVHAKPVTAIATPARARVQSIEKKLVELDPVWQAFCSRHEYQFLPSRELWPNRSALAFGKVDRQIDLTMDVPFKAVLERGFFPEMPWSLYARALLPFCERGSKAYTPAVIPSRDTPRPVLTFELFRRRPFLELAQVLDQGLERGFAMLREVTREDIFKKGQVPQGRSGPFVNYPL